MRAAQIIWAGAGRPDPCDTSGEPIPAKGTGGPCAACGEPGRYRLREAISDNFTTVKNASRAWPYGGNDVCAACVFACKTLALRLAISFSREDGVWFIGTRPLPGLPWTRPDALSALLCPPAPPFVAMWPAYGIDHGGEANIERCWWPGSTPHASPLVKLQSKHVAIYARVATSRERYPLQIDDNHDVIVDVVLWTRLRAVCEAMLAEMRAGGVGATDARDALVRLRPPLGCPVRMVAHWPALTSSLRPHHGAVWWPYFVSLLEMPALVKKERTDGETDRGAGPDERRQERAWGAAPARVPAPRDEAPGEPGRGGGGALQGALFGDV